MKQIVLNEDQQAAEDAIVAAFERGEREFLLEGSAGVGKTTLIQSVIKKIQKSKKSSRKFGPKIVALAPTHKAVHVIGDKLDEAGLQDVERMTLAALLGLKPTAGDTEKQILKRNPTAKSKTGFFDVVALDECSMVGADYQKFIDSDLTFHFVLYVGDSAQLPPVGEEIASCFKQVAERNRFKLTKIVRQAEGNPILQAAQILRLQQGTGKMDWSWLAQEFNAETKQGIFHCGDKTDAWLRQAFTSKEFKEDNDAYRYIAYTNARVKEVNRKIRGWIYGETVTPYVVGERVLCRNPVLNEDDKPIFSTNEEAIVNSIELDSKFIAFSNLGPAAGQHAIPGWSYELPVWKIGLRKLYAEENTEYGNECYAYMAQNEQEYMNIDRKLVAEAKGNRNRWREYFGFKDSIADIRPVYSLTAHSSQGSTFGVAFIDVPDIASRIQANMLEAQKLYYVALTRASKAVVLVGV